MIDVCGESISVPTYISDWAQMNEDNKTELDGFIDSIVWAVKKQFKNKESENSNNNINFNGFLKGYDELLKSLFED